MFSEHQRMRPVLDQARRFDIASNPDPQAIFEAGSAGFQVWCTPEDHPQGWEDIKMTAGAFSKPCEYVGSVFWKWEDDRIVGLQIETSAYALADQMPDKYSNPPIIPKGIKRQSIVKEQTTFFNREQDVNWLKKKIAWLFEKAGVLLLPFEYEYHDSDTQPRKNAGPKNQVVDNV
jgi:hypothetical protein